MRSNHQERHREPVDWSAVYVITPIQPGQPLRSCNICQAPATVISTLANGGDRPRCEQHQQMRETR